MISCIQLVATICLLFGSVFGDIQDDAAVDARVLKLEQGFSQLQQTVVDLQRKVDVQNDVFAYTPIAFTAVLTHSLTSIGIGQQIVFDKVITNVGTAYSHYSGHFTAPVSGVYAFFVVITNNPGHSASIALVKNGARISGTIAHGTSQNNQLYVTSTTAATVELQQGDEVWVQDEDSNHLLKEEIDGGDWSSFSGHIIGTM